MRIFLPLLLGALSAFPAFAFEERRLTILPVESNKCSIYLALTGNMMEGCTSVSNKFQTVRSIDSDQANGYIVHFGFDSGALGKAEQEHLTRLSGLLNDKLTDLCIKLVGHTDTTGSKGYNQGLSIRRAQSVKLFLVGPGGVDAARVLSKGHGESFPIVGLPGSDGQNRRVEILAKKMPSGQCA